MEKAVGDFVTGFDSKSPEGDGTGRDIEYPKVFAALEHSQEVAENAFSRYAKFDLANRMGPAVRRVALDQVKELDLYPVWLSEVSVVLKVEEYTDDLNEKRGEELAVLTIRVMSSIVNLDDKIVYLIDPLRTTIKYVSKELVKFTAKQKWSFQDE